MVRYKHAKSGKVGTVHIYEDGLCRLAAYVPGDRQWKKKTKQLHVTEDQANAAIARGENYVGMSWTGSSRRALVHSKNLTPLP